MTLSPLVDDLRSGEPETFCDLGGSHKIPWVDSVRHGCNVTTEADRFGY